MTDKRSLEDLSRKEFLSVDLPFPRDGIFEFRLLCGVAQIRLGPTVKLRVVACFHLYLTLVADIDNYLRRINAYVLGDLRTTEYPHSVDFHVSFLSIDVQGTESIFVQFVQSLEESTNQIVGI